MDVGSAFGPAFQYMTRLLFRPFVFKKWLGLGFAFLLAGMGGGFNFNFPSQREPNGPQQMPPPQWDTVTTWLEHHILLVIAAGAAIFLISIVFIWLSSVFKFVYTEQIVRDTGAIKEPFARLKRLGKSYFLWQLGFALVVAIILGVLVALPILSVFVFVPDVGLGLKVGVTIIAALIGIVVIIGAGITDIFARDFVVTTMYVRNLKVLEAWRVVLPILRANAGQIILYLLILIVIAICIGIAGIFIALAVMLALLIPVGLLVLIGYLIFMAAHLTWTPVVIGIAATLGIIVLLGITYLMQCAFQPLGVFRRSFALIVIGQADPMLVTIPTGTIPPGSQVSTE